MKTNDLVKIVATDGNYRYGYIESIRDRGAIFTINLFDEAESKIAYDAASDTLVGGKPIDYLTLLTDVEKRIVPFLSASMNTNEIAAKMNISPTTVRAHLRTLRIKLHLDDRAQLIAFSQALHKMLIKQELRDGRNGSN